MNLCVPLSLDKQQLRLVKFKLPENIGKLKIDNGQLSVVREYRKESVVTLTEARRAVLNLLEGVLDTLTSTRVFLDFPSTDVKQYDDGHGVGKIFDDMPSLPKGCFAQGSDTKITLKNCSVSLYHQPVNWNMEKVVLPSGETKLKYTRYKYCNEENLNLENYFEDDQKNHHIGSFCGRTGVEDNESEELETNYVLGKGVKLKSKSLFEDEMKWIEVKDEFSPNLLPSPKMKRHSKKFIDDALNMCDAIGVMRTAKKLNVSRINLTRWRRNMGRESQKLRNRHPEKFKKEVLDYYSRHGINATKAKYNSVDASNICKWKKKYGVDPIISSEDRRFKLEVVSYSKEKGLKAASNKFDVPIQSIWDWKAKQNRRDRRLKAQIARITKPSNREKGALDHDNELRNKVVKYYKQHGSKACEDEFKIPRQTVRNWAINFGQSVIGEKKDRNAIEKPEALKLAKQEGVKKAMEVFRIKRGTLYNWAKKVNAEVCEGDNNSLELSLTKEGKKRNLVFARVKKPKKVKEKKLKVPKPRKIKQAKPAQLEHTVELPEWAASFIGAPKINSGTRKTEAMLPSSDFSTVDCEIFTMTIPVIQTPFFDILDTINQVSEECIDSSSESEYECNEYSEFSFPFFSPSQQESIGTRGASIDPPSVA